MRSHPATRLCSNGAMSCSGSSTRSRPHATARAVSWSWKARPESASPGCSGWPVSGARSTGVNVLRARASELEREFPFGVALQLFETSFSGLAAAERRALLGGAASLAAPLFTAARGTIGAATDGQGFSLLHGLYWLAANLAERGPLLLAIDDLHWADTPSLRFLHYLVHRVEDLPIAVVLATRAEFTGEQRELGLRLVAHPNARVLALAPLTPDGTAALVHDVFAAPDGTFTDCCAELTRGNPFLLRELLRSLAQEGATPDAATARRMTAYDVAPQTIVRAAAVRLARLPSPRIALARAVAILGDDARGIWAARLAGLDSEAAAAAVDALDRAGIIEATEPLALVHPLVAAAITAEIPPADRAAEHRRAAHLLSSEGVAEDRLAAHLLRSPCAGDELTVTILRAAGARAVARGAPESAVVYLGRALDEPPEPGRRGELLMALGDARAATGGTGAAEPFRAALALAERPDQRAVVRWKLGRVLFAQGRHADAGAEFERARAEVIGHDAALARRFGFASLTSALVTRSGPAMLTGDTRAQVDDLLAQARSTPLTADELAPLVGLSGMAGESRQTILALADEALRDGRLVADVVGDQGHAVTMVAIGLLYADELVRSERMLDLALAHARRQAALLAVATLSYARAWPLYFQGRLAEAVADAQDARAARQFGWQMYPVAAAAVLAHALIELGDLTAAGAVLDGEHADGREAEWTMLLGARGRLLLAEHDAAGALAVLEECGRMLSHVGVPTRPMPWRSSAALAAAALGDRTRAKPLLAEELADARRVGAPRQVGVALRATGLLTGGTAGIELLREAVETLQTSDAQLELARTLIDFGAALRRGGERAASRPPLRRGLELAHGFGASPLVARAQTELKATGARPRRIVTSGVASLTASERRVAEMAAGGLTNRQIAESLFVTTKAVEYHLRHVYHKLDIQRRQQIAGALANE